MIPNVSIHCPYCNEKTAVSPAPLSIPGGGGYSGDSVVLLKQLTPEDPFLYRHGEYWWMGQCNAFLGPVLVRNDGDPVYPTPRPGPVSADIPEPMRSDLLEAKRCVAAGAWNAAAVMARRSLQCAAVALGSPTGGEWPLWRQIKWLDDSRKITPEQREWADAARWVGNHGAHDTEPNVAAGQAVITDVTEEDAKDTIGLVEHLFETLYVARVQAQQQLAKWGRS